MKGYLVLLISFFIFMFVGSIIFNLAYPKKILPYLSGENSPLRQIACTYPVYVSTPTMQPILKQGSVKLFNKCINEIRDNLVLGDIVVYKDKGLQRIATVRARTFSGLEAVEYEVSSETGRDQPMMITPNRILAIYR